MFLGRQVPGWTSSKDEFPPDKFQKGEVGGVRFSRKDPKFICIGYKLPTFGEYMPFERFLCAHIRYEGLQHNLERALKMTCRESMTCKAVCFQMSSVWLSVCLRHRQLKHSIITPHSSILMPMTRCYPVTSTLLFAVLKPLEQASVLFFNQCITLNKSYFTN